MRPVQPIGENAALSLVAVLTPELKERSDYLELPFQVPRGTRRIEISYRYPGQRVPGSGNEVDLGLSDPRGSSFPDFPGFRGWSGNARDRAVLTEATATPGYLAGPITAGTWRVLLGLYKVREQGCEVQVEVRMSHREGALPQPAPGPARVLARPGGHAWYRGDLHTHSHHSDAPGSLEDLVEAGLAAGLDFLAVTDHNTTSHLRYLPALAALLVLIPGEEVTSYYGHLNVWGNSHPLDFRCRFPDQMRQVIDAAHRAGALVSASHPAAPGMGWTFGEEQPLDCIEVFHGPSGELNANSLELWEDLLRRGRKVVAVGGSDFHCGKQGEGDRLGQPTVWVKATSRSVAGVLEGVKAGRVTLTCAGGPWLEFWVESAAGRWEPGDGVPPGPVRARCAVKRGNGLRLRLLSALGDVQVGDEIDLAEHRYLRAELRRPGSAGFPVVAMTNPIWGAGS